MTEWHAERYVGTVVADRYHVDRVLGAGGMGFVVAATHVLTGRHVALKIMPDTDVSSVDRIMVEARVPGLIHHPHIVPVIDVAYDVGLKAHLLVQELLEGHDLRDELDRCRRLPWRDAIMLLLPVIDAVAAAHDAGVVHRDLKPENIFLQTDKPVIVPWVLDFGIARITTQVPNNGRLTTVGAAFGTPSYMSPEQARGERDVDPGSDIWALGVILFEMLVGFTPFDRDNYNATLAAIQTKDPLPLGRLVGVPREVTDVVMRALKKERNDRFADAHEMYRALDAAMPSIPAGSGTAVTAPPPPMVAAPRRLAAALAVMVACAVTIVGAGAVGMVHGDQPHRMPTMRAALIKNIHVAAPTTRLSAVSIQDPGPGAVVAVVPQQPPTARPIVPTTPSIPRPRRVAAVASVSPPSRTVPRGPDGSIGHTTRNGAPIFEP